MDDNSFVLVKLGERGCDVERARHSTRAQGPSHMSDIPDHREDDKVVQEGCSRWTTLSGEAIERVESLGDAPEPTRTCRHCGHSI